MSGTVRYTAVQWMELSERGGEQGWPHPCLRGDEAEVEVVLPCLRMGWDGILGRDHGRDACVWGGRGKAEGMRGGGQGAMGGGDGRACTRSSMNLKKYGPA